MPHFMIVFIPFIKKKSWIIKCLFLRNIQPFRASFRASKAELKCPNKFSTAPFQCGFSYAYLFFSFSCVGGFIYDIVLAFFFLITKTRLYYFDPHKGERNRSCKYILE